MCVCVCVCVYNYVVIFIFISQIHLCFIAHQPGQLCITGFSYDLTAPNLLSSNDLHLIGGPVSNDLLNELNGITVRGKLNLELTGKRLNVTTSQKQGREYSTDRRLDFIAVPPMPLLQVINNSSKPE